MEDFFETMITIDNAHYDTEEQVVLLFITLLDTGEKRILVESKNDFRFGEGGAGDFPDRYMHQHVENLKKLTGKPRKWRLYTDPQTQQATSEHIENITKRVGVQMEELTNVIGSDERIMERKKEDLGRVEKMKTQKLALDKVREEFQKGLKSEN